MGVPSSTAGCGTPNGPAPHRPRITLAQFENAFIPFALLLLLALLLPEMEQDLDRFRTLYTIRAATVLLIPAMSFFVFRDRSESVSNYWLLFWTLSYIAYLAHFYWAVGVFFHWDVPLVFRTMGVGIAGSNLLLTGWWGLDVFLSWRVWFTGQDSKLVRLERWGAHGFVFVVFVYTALVLRGGVVRPLGFVLLSSTGICLVARAIDSTSRTREATS